MTAEGVAPTKRPFGQHCCTWVWLPVIHMPESLLPAALCLCGFSLCTGTVQLIRWTTSGFSHCHAPLINASHMCLHRKHNDVDGSSKTYWESSPYWWSWDLVLFFWVCFVQWGRLQGRTKDNWKEKRARHECLFKNCKYCCAFQGLPKEKHKNVQ